MLAYARQYRAILRIVRILSLFKNGGARLTQEEPPLVAKKIWPRKRVKVRSIPQALKPILKGDCRRPT